MGNYLKKFCCWSVSKENKEGEITLPDRNWIEFMPNGTNKINVLLIGETGSGKSNFINYLANYFEGGWLCSLKVVIPTSHYQVNVAGFFEHSEANLDDGSKSHTLKCNSYKFKRAGTTFTFIDTPGFSDTSEADNYNLNLIMEYLKDLQFVRSIVLVINGTTARNTVNVRNYLAKIAGCFPTSILHNLIVVYTNSLCNRVTFNEEEMLVVKPKKSFAMDNSAFMLTHWNELAKNHKEIQEEIWNASMSTIKEFLNSVENELQSVSTNEFTKMIKLRAKINVKIEEFIYEISSNQELLVKNEVLEKERLASEQLLGTARVELKDATEFLSHSIQKAESCKSALLSLQTRDQLLKQKLSMARSNLSEISTQLTATTKNCQMIERHITNGSGQEMAFFYPELVPTQYSNFLCKHNECITTCHETCNEACCSLRINSYGKCNQCGHDKADHYKSKNKKVSRTKKVAMDTISQAKNKKKLIQELRKLENKKALLQAEIAELKQNIHLMESESQLLSKQLTSSLEEEQNAQKTILQAASRKSDAEAAFEQAEIDVSSLSSQPDNICSTKNMPKVKKLCRKMQDICKHFDFESEMKCRIDMLEAKQRCLQTCRGSEKITEEVNALILFLRNFNPL